MTFALLDTEANFDFVDVFSADGAAREITGAGDLGRFDGSQLPAALEGAALVRYTTDESVLGSGFEAILILGLVISLNSKKAAGGTYGAPGNAIVPVANPANGALVPAKVP